MRSLTTMALLGVSMAGPAIAATLSLDGVWGNEAGCKYHRDQSREDDTMRLLRPDGVESFVTDCDWAHTSKGKGEAQLAIGICAYEGEDALGSDTFVIAPDMADPTLLKIYTNNGEIWGEVRKCP